MSDPSQIQPARDGQGKALAAGAVTFASVLLAILFQDRYGEVFKEVKDAGYPLPVIIAGIAGVLSHLITWWTSKDLVGVVIGWIKGWKKIKQEWNNP
jgi:hypothetical protein